MTIEQPFTVLDLCATRCVYHKILRERAIFAMEQNQRPVDSKRRRRLFGLLTAAAVLIVLLLALGLIFPTLAQALVAVGVLASAAVALAQYLGGPQQRGTEDE